VERKSDSTRRVFAESSPDQGFFFFPCLQPIQTHSHFDLLSVLHLLVPQRTRRRSLGFFPRFKQVRSLLSSLSFPTGIFSSHPRPPSTHAPLFHSSSPIGHSSSLPRPIPIQNRPATSTTSSATTNATLPPRPILARGNMFQTSLPKRPNPFARDPPQT